MKAALYREIGAASRVLSIEELPVPEPGAGEVRVRIACSGVNPTDCKVRSGATGAPPKDFQIPHQDGSGVIDALGEGVTDHIVGERVWLYLAAFQNKLALPAEYSVLPAARAVRLPDGASDELGASLGVPALTAAHCLGGDHIALEGSTVLVAGGAGAVGHFAIELAKHANARVIATVSSEEKAELARAAGCDFVVNYRDGSAIHQLRSFTPRVDYVVELALGSNLELDLAVAGAGTVINVYANEPTDPVIPTRRFMAANTSIRYMLITGSAPRNSVPPCRGLVRRLMPEPSLSCPFTAFPLMKSPPRRDDVEAGAVGKVLVLPGA